VRHFSPSFPLLVFLLKQFRVAVLELLPQSLTSRLLASLILFQKFNRIDFSKQLAVEFDSYHHCRRHHHYYIITIFTAFYFFPFFVLPIGVLLH